MLATEIGHRERTKGFAELESLAHTLHGRAPKHRRTNDIGRFLCRIAHVES
jgi:hypothetical protein